MKIRLNENEQNNLSDMNIVKIKDTEGWAMTDGNLVKLKLIHEIK